MTTHANRSWQRRQRLDFGFSTVAASSLPLHAGFVPVLALDTSYLIVDLRFFVKRRAPSIFLQTVSRGLFHCYVGPHFHTEVLDKIPEQAKELGVDPAYLLELFTTNYAPHLRQLSPINATSQTITDLTARDRTDVPLAQLIELLRPDVVLHRDKDLNAYSDYRQHEADTLKALMWGPLQEGSIQWSWWLAVQTLWQSYEGLRSTAVAFSKLPGEVQWFLSGTLLGVSLMLRPNHLAVLHDRLEPVRSVFKSLGQAFYDELKTISTNHMLAEPVVEAARPNLAPPKKELDLIPHVLASTKKPLTVEELRFKIAALTLAPPLRRDERLAEMMTQHPMLWREGDGHWSLRYMHLIQ